MPFFSSLSSLSIFSVSHHKILCNDKKHYFLIKTSLFPSTLQDIITKFQVDKGCALYTQFTILEPVILSRSLAHTLFVCLCACVRVLFGTFFIHSVSFFIVGCCSLSLSKSTPFSNTSPSPSVDIFFSAIFNQTRYFHSSKNIYFCIYKMSAHIIV